MAGLLDMMDDPQSQGLLSLGLRLMSTPGRFGTALGTAGLGAMGDMQQAMQMQQQRKRQAMLDEQMQMQMAAAKEAQARQAEALARAQAIEQRKNSYLDSMGGMQGPGMPFDPMAALSAGLDPQMIKFMAEAPNLGRSKVARTIERRGADGRPEVVQVDEFGREVGQAMAQPVKLQLENMGGTSQAVDPYSLIPGQQFRRTQSPDSVASTESAAAARAQADRQFNARLEFDRNKPLGGNQRTGPMSVTLQKELLESDDAVQSAASVVRALETAKAQNKTAYSGYLAKPRATLTSNVVPGGTAAADATIDIDNLMTGQGLESMKAIFGAAPTEGERKILLDMQASVDKTPVQREAIMDRAIAAAKRRAAYADAKAKAIRDGSYLTDGVPAVPEVQAPQAGPKPGTVENGYRFKGGNPADPKNWEKV
jgi:hypothetical protein